MEEWFLARGYLKAVVNNQRDKVVLVEPSLLRKLWQVIFLLLLTITLIKVKELGKLIRDLLPFYLLIVMEKLKRFSRLIQSHLTKMREK